MAAFEGWERLWVWVNGELKAATQAAVSVFDRGFLYGDGVFEGFRLLEGSRVFRLTDHLGRLYESARAIGLSVGYSPEELKAALAEVVRRSGLGEGHLRIVATRGPAPPGLDPRSARRPTVVVMAYPFGENLRPPHLAGGLRAKLAATRRWSPQALDPKVKCLNYLNEILAELEAVVSGFDTAIMLGEDGFLAEAAAANIFLVRRRRLYTPYPNYCLAGITRAAVMELARGCGFEVEERNLTPADLFNADEVFLTSTAVDVAPVVEVDGRPVGTGEPGPVWAELRARFLELMSREAEALF
jgi:branched-chain amino acid aminotransferase